MLEVASCAWAEDERGTCGAKDPPRITWRIYGEQDSYAKELTSHQPAERQEEAGRWRPKTKIFKLVVRGESLVSAAGASKFVALLFATATQCFSTSFSHIFTRTLPCGAQAMARFIGRCV